MSKPIKIELTPEDYVDILWLMSKGVKYCAQTKEEDTSKASQVLTNFLGVDEPSSPDITPSA